MTLAQKRFSIAVPLGVAFGFLCAYLASSNMQGNFWWTPMMWIIVVSRMLTGFFIACTGVYTIHPVFRIKVNAYMRGAGIGMITSLTLAIGTLIPSTVNTPDWKYFWATLIMGIVYGIIIDVCATKFAGEGEKLLK